MAQPQRYPCLPGIPAAIGGFAQAGLDLANQLLGLAAGQGQVMLALRNRGLEVEIKANGTVVTNADLAVHEALVAGLPLLLDVPVVSEETPLHLESGEPETWWLIDPIDGTRSYRDGYDGFCVSIALIQWGRPILGVIEAPACGEAYVGILGQGAYRLGAGGDCRRLAACPKEHRPFRFGGFYNQAAADRARLGALLEHHGVDESAVEKVSSAIKYCRVADGSLDMAGGWATLDHWDVAAADIIVHEAGGWFGNADTGKVYHYLPGLSVVSAPMAAAARVMSK